MAERLRANYLKKYIGKSADIVMKDFPNAKVRILFPEMSYVQDYCKDRINVVVLNGKINRIWRD